MYVVVPVTVAIAVIRDDLYEVDRAVVAASVYGFVGVVLLGVFTAVSSAAGLVAARASTQVAVLVTAVVAVFLGTVRSRLGGAVGVLLPGPGAGDRRGGDTAARGQRGDGAPEQLEPVLRTAPRDPTLRVPTPSPETPTSSTATDTGSARTTARYRSSWRATGSGCSWPAATFVPGLLREVAGEAALLVEVGPAAASS